MLQPVLILLDPLLRPTERTRRLCLLLLVTLVTALLYLGSQPGMQIVFPYLLWDKLVADLTGALLVVLLLKVMKSQVVALPAGGPVREQVEL